MNDRLHHHRAEPLVDALAGIPVSLHDPLRAVIRVLTSGASTENVALAHVRPCRQCGGRWRWGDAGGGPRRCSTCEPPLHPAGVNWTLDGPTIAVAAQVLAAQPERAGVDR